MHTFISYKLQTMLTGSFAWGRGEEGKRSKEDGSGGKGWDGSEGGRLETEVG